MKNLIYKKKNNEIIKDKKINEFSKRFCSNLSNKKLIYKLIINQELTIKIIEQNYIHNFTYVNNNFIYNRKIIKSNNNIFFIFFNFILNLYEISLDEIKICNINYISDIVLYGSKDYNLSINYPLSIDNTNIETNINLMNTLDNLLYFDIAQINILD